MEFLVPTIITGPMSSLPAPFHCSVLLGHFILLAGIITAECRQEDNNGQ